MKMETPLRDATCVRSAEVRSGPWTSQGPFWCHMCLSCGSGNSHAGHCLVGQTPLPQGGGWVCWRPKKFEPKIGLKFHKFHFCPRKIFLMWLGGWVGRGWPGPQTTPQGLALIFIPAGGGGGGGSPLDPLPPSPGPPPPPPPSAQVHLKTWVLGTQSCRKKFRRLGRMPYTVYILLHVCSIYLVFQTTMPKRSLSVYFSSHLPHQFHAMQATVCARWAAQLPRTWS